MQIIIGQVLSADEVKTVLAALKRARFVDGRATAGFAARLVKDNRQAEGADRSLATIRRLIAERILGNEMFRLAVRPKTLSPLLLARYDKGMHYGSHVDDALMDGMRTDVAFTLFLSDPKSYDGRGTGDRERGGRRRDQAGRRLARCLSGDLAPSRQRCHARGAVRGRRLGA